MGPQPASPRIVLIGAETPVGWRIALAVLMAIAFLAALYVARAVLLPVALAILLSFLLAPIVRFLRQLHLPEVVGAGLVVAVLLALVVSAITMLSDPAFEWLQRAPEVLARMQQRLDWLLEVFQKFTHATEQMARLATPGRDSAAVTVRGSWPGFLLGRTGQFFGSLVVMLFLLYFLLASGKTFMRKLVQVMPCYSQKKGAVMMVRTIEHDISRYLFTVAVINTALGVLVGSVMFALGMPNPLLWGVMAGLLNFVPYLGPMVTLTVLTAVALLTFEDVATALLRPLTFFAITSLEGQLLTPLILGRRLMLNPVVIFVSLIFWGWLWGIVGALVAVPLTMIVKIFCDSVPPLRPVGILLSR